MPLPPPPSSQEEEPEGKKAAAAAEGQKGAASTKDGEQETKVPPPEPSTAGNDEPWPSVEGCWSPSEPPVFLRPSLLPLTNAHWLPSGDGFISGSYDRTATIWDVGDQGQQPECRHKFEGPWVSGSGVSACRTDGASRHDPR